MPKVFVCISCLKKPDVTTPETIFGCYNFISNFCDYCDSRETCTRRLVQPQAENSIVGFCLDCNIDMEG